MTAVGASTFGAAVSEHPDAAHAVAEAAGAVLDQVGPGADVALLFVTGPHVDAIDDIADRGPRDPRCPVPSSVRPRSA